MTDDQRYNDSNHDESVNQPDTRNEGNVINGQTTPDQQISGDSGSSYTNYGHQTDGNSTSGQAAGGYPTSGYQTGGYQHYQQPSAGASPTGPSGPNYSNNYNQPYGQSGAYQPYGQAGANQPYGQPGPNPYWQAQANELLLMEYPGNEKRLVKLASRGIRFGAYLIDSFISGIPSAIVAIFFLIKFFQLIWTPYTGLMNYVDPGSGMIVNFDHFLSVNYSDIRAMIFWFIALLVVSLLAQILFYALIPIWTNGQTLGKKILKLRAVHEDGHYLSTGAQLLRGLVGVILLAFVTSNMTMWISAVMILVTDKRQGIHDYMASSVVISEKAF